MLREALGLRYSLQVVISLTWAFVWEIRDFCYQVWRGKRSGKRLVGGGRGGPFKVNNELFCVDLFFVGAPGTHDFDP